MPFRSLEQQGLCFKLMNDAFRNEELPKWNCYNYAKHHGIIKKLKIPFPGKIKSKKRKTRSKKR